MVTRQARQLVLRGRVLSRPVRGFGPERGAVPVRILFACKQHFEVGGIERTTDQLARRLVRRGHEVAVLAPPRSGGPTGGPAGVERRELEGYPAWVAVGVAPGPA